MTISQTQPPGDVAEDARMDSWHMRLLPGLPGTIRTASTKELVYLIGIYRSSAIISRSQRVNEIRPLITKKLDLTAIQSLNPVIPISTQTLTVLESEEQILHHGTTKLEKD
jgi:hypothetical protein